MSLNREFFQYHSHILEFLNYQKSETKGNKPIFSTELSFTSLIHSIETLMEEIKTEVTE